MELPWIEVIPIADSKNNRQYELYVKLPESYSENEDKKYPVIYYTDAMLHIEALSSAAGYIMEDAILVGISYEKDLKGDLAALGEHASRYRDYSVNEAKNPEHQAKYHLGQASNHLTFIRNQVMKFVEDTYRTDPDNRTYFGYSLGGLFGAYILVAEPNTFKNYILGSPALRGDIPLLSDELGSTLESNEGLNANVFISIGSLEEEVGYVDELIALLRARNDASLSLTHEIIEGNHQSAFPLTTVRSVVWLAELLKK